MTVIIFKTAVVLTHSSTFLTVYHSRVSTQCGVVFLLDNNFGHVYGDTHVGGGGSLETMSSGIMGHRIDGSWVHRLVTLGTCILG